MKRLLCNLCNSSTYEVKHNTVNFEFIACKNCGLHYVRVINEEGKDKSISNFYEDYFFSKPFVEMRDKCRHLFLYSFSKKVYEAERIRGEKYDDKSSFLDIGCGGGNYLEAAEALGWNAYGIEIDKENAQKARDRGLDVNIGTLQVANYPGNFFDLIQLKQVLEHVQDPFSLINEIYRIFKKGGILVVDTPNQEGLIPKLKIRFHLKKEEYGFLQPAEHMHMYAFTLKTLSQLLKRNNFAIKKKLITIPGDLIYQPLLSQRIINKIILKLTDVFKRGSILVIYAQK